MQFLKEDRYKKIEIGLLIAFVVAAYVIMNFIPMTDGDDAYFSKMANSMNLFDYLKMRYNEWEGRMTSEAMTYIAFRFGKGFWEAANAIMLMLLPTGVLKIVSKIIPQSNNEKHFYLFLAVFASLLFMDIDVIGYSAFWITGSTFYLWSVVAGIWAAVPFVELIYRPEEKSKTSFLYAVPCGFIAAMGLEQITAIVITFGIIAVATYFFRNRKIAWPHLLLIVLMIVSLYILFIAPGTQVRTETEINAWLPQFADMSIGQHIFITVQWLLSALANESKMYFIMIWLISAYVLFQRRERTGRILGIAAVIFSVAAALPYIGITFLSEMGIGVTDITKTVTKVAEFKDLSPSNIIAMGWWIAAFLFTLILLWFYFEHITERLTAVLMVLASLASGALMGFSPTIYASGERVLFVTELMLWVLCAWLFGTLKGVKTKRWGILIFVIAGIINFSGNISYLLTFFNS